MVVRKRLDLQGPAMFFITTTVRDWIPLFSNERCAEEFLSQLRETLSFYRLSLAAYVLMPTHFHALLGLKECAQLSQIMQSLKSLSSRRILKILPRQFEDYFRQGNQTHFWKPRFDDLVIWSDKQFVIKADYIHNNPVKAKLVKQPTDYLYSSAKDWLSDESGLVPIDKDWQWAG